jgi:GT2 family glycosyltransferase
MMSFSDAYKDGEFEIYVRNDDDIGSISLKEITAEHDGVIKKLISVTASDLNDYFRLMWPIDSANDLIEAGKGHLKLNLRFGFEHWDVGEDFQWIAILKTGDFPGHRFHHKIEPSQIQPVEDGVVVKITCALPEANERLFLAMQFRRDFRAASLSHPEMTCSIPAYIRTFKAEITDFMLHIEGWAANELLPGVPVRLRLYVGDVLKTVVLARSELLPDSPDYLQTGSLRFKVRMALREAELGLPIRLVVAETGETLEVELGQGNDEGEEPAPPEILPTYTVAGNVERINQSSITGWAAYREAVDAPVELILYIDGVPFQKTVANTFREDLKTNLGGLGFNSFSFELPPNITLAGPAKFSIQPSCGVNAIKGAANVLKQLGLHNEPAILQAARAIRPAPTLAKPAGLSVIILNRNGADILRETLDTGLEHDDSEAIEWIVVDHNSTDGSDAVIEEMREKYPDRNLKYFPRGRNFSFSESNNFGAEQASGEILVFANNDLIFFRPYANRLLKYFRDPAIGVVGVQLLDHIENDSWMGRAPTQHTGVYFSPMTQNNWLRPYESRKSLENGLTLPDAMKAAAVTGAFMAMRRSDFEAVGGFDEAYSYGLEDVDLCLKARAILKKEVVCANDIVVTHHRGFSRVKDTDAGIRRRNNNRIFNRKWSSSLRRVIRDSGLSDAGVWTGTRPVVGFIVSDAGDLTSAGEYYTASELGRAMQKMLPIHARYITEPEWYDLTGVDILVVMVNKFDIHRVKQANPFLVSINWMRQWFDRWAADDSIYAYDYLFASSQTAADYVANRTGRPVDVLPIATNFETFSKGKRRQDLVSDYCFTGSRFGMTRAIELQLKPDTIQGTGRIYGFNWEATPFEAMSAGPVNYSGIPDIYASTKIVLDDANIATKDWGSCNSRVFDAMAGGCLLITNGALGVQELFGDLVPTFDSEESLTETVNYWLSHDDERQARIAQLRKLIREEHTYDARAEVVIRKLLQTKPATRVSIKCAAISSEKAQWGDYHFAMSLAAALRPLGYTVRVDCREAWESGIADTDDVVICLRGLLAYKPKPHQINILWIISHPDVVTAAELQDYDHVYVAAERHAAMLAEASGRPTEFLPQCTDRNRFFFNEETVNTHPERALYVGNSRGVFRDPVLWSMEHNVDIDIYGVGWEPFISDPRLKGRLVPNEVLGDLYGASRVVICDHWDDMRRLGYVSNRLFDVIAAGGELLIDDVAGLGELVPGGYHVYGDADDFVAKCRQERPFDRSKRKELSDWVLAHHSFDSRARTISERVQTFVTAMLSPAPEQA